MERIVRFLIFYDFDYFVRKFLLSVFGRFWTNYIWDPNSNRGFCFMTMISPSLLGICKVLLFLLIKLISFCLQMHFWNGLLFFGVFFNRNLFSKQLLCAITGLHLQAWLISGENASFWSFKEKFLDRKVCFEPAFGLKAVIFDEWILVHLIGN